MPDNFPQNHAPQPKILFLVFCLEMYARRHEISGAEAMRIFDASKACDFLMESYEPLHTLDREAILDELEVFLESTEKK